MRTAIARVVLLLSLVPCASAVAQPRRPPLPPVINLSINRATRLLVVAPHPDDDVIGAAGLIRRVVKAGGAVRVVFATSGDGFPEGVETAEGISPLVAHLTPRDYETYGRLREQEARAALGSLGVKPSALTFLGFPDEGLCELASTYLSAKTQAFKSPYTGRISPPLTEQVIRGVRYRGFDLRRELVNLLLQIAGRLSLSGGGRVIVDHGQRPEQQYHSHHSQIGRAHV